MNNISKILVAMAVMIPAMQPDASAEIPQGYYDGLSGLKGKELKEALHEIIKNPSTPSYGTGSNGTWWAFYVTDQLPDGTYRNRYSDLKFPVGSRGSRPQKDNVGTKNKNGNYVEMNIEHSFPSSWWGSSSKNAQYSDLFNLYPSDNSTNSSKSNYIMDEVASQSSDDGYTKLGTSTHTSESRVWEPVDNYKGDFSRGYMYMITCWQGSSWTSRSTQFLDQNTYPTLKDWAAELYSKWCRQDRVDQIEIDRNNAVYSIQGNRNPFIDFPNLFEYLWGDSTDVAFDPKKTVIADGNYNPGTGGGDEPDPDFDPTDPSNFNRLPSILSVNFKTSDGGVTEDTEIAPTGKTTVWRRDTRFGWVANGYIDGIRYDCDATLITPVIDLTGVDVAFVRFSHAVNFYTSPKDCLTVYVMENGVSTSINDLVDWPEGTSWAFMTTSPIDLKDYCGKRIQLGFRYTSNSSICPAWEVGQLDVKGTQTTSGIDNIITDDAGFDVNQSAEYYTIDGRRVDETATGLIIVRQGGHVYKMIR